MTHVALRLDTPAPGLVIPVPVRRLAAPVELLELILTSLAKAHRRGDVIEDSVHFVVRGDDGGLFAVGVTPPEHQLLVAAKAVDDETYPYAAAVIREHGHLVAFEPGDGTLTTFRWNGDEWLYDLGRKPRRILGAIPRASVFRVLRERIREAPAPAPIAFRRDGHPDAEAAIDAVVAAAARALETGFQEVRAFVVVPTSSGFGVVTTEAGGEDIVGEHVELTRAVAESLDGVATIWWVPSDADDETCFLYFERRGRTTRRDVTVTGGRAVMDDERPMPDLDWWTLPENLGAECAEPVAAE